MKKVQTKDYTRVAIWLIVTYLILLTLGTIGAVKGLWLANDAVFNLLLNN